MKYLLLSIIFVASLSNAQELISFKEMKSVQFNGQYIDKNVELGPNAILKVSFEITSKGNGGTPLIDRYLRLYDSHNDLIYFKDGLLRNELVDLNGDGFLDLRLSGIAMISNENDKVIAEKPINAELIYSPKKHSFDVKSRSEEIYISKKRI